MQIRNATESDLPKIILIENASFDQPYPADLLKKLLRKYGDSFLVAEQSGKLVGYCTASLNGRLAHLISIGVLEENRRKGIGASLLRALINFLNEQGVNELWLEVKTLNEEAIGFYQRFGFNPMMIVENYYSNGSAALRMKLSLKSQPEQAGGG